MKLSTQSLLKNLPNDQTLIKLFPQLQEEKMQSFTTLALTLIASAIFGLFAINPTFGTIADLRKQLDDSEFVDQQLTQKIANLSTLQQKYNQLQNAIPVVLNAIPATPATTQLIGQLQALAQESNISLKQIQTFPVEVSPSNTNSPFVSYEFSLDIEGTYDGITSFISSLGNFNRLIVVDGISLAQAAVTANTQQTGGPIRATVKGKAYFKSL